MLDNGEIIECDHPHTLLSKPDGGFAQMVKMAGDQEHQLRQAAEKVSGFNIKTNKFIKKKLNHFTNA